MNIQSVRYKVNEQGEKTSMRVVIDGQLYGVPINDDNRYYKEVKKWLEEGNEPLPPEEPQKTWDNIRSERNQLLNQTDWVVIRARETNTNVPSDWKTYRQALRDITDTFENPNDVVFPEPPTT